MYQKNHSTYDLSDQMDDIFQRCPLQGIKKSTTDQIVMGNVVKELYSV